MMRKLPTSFLDVWKCWYHPSEEVIFESNRIKEQHETMKLQNEEVMLS